ILTAKLCKTNEGFFNRIVKKIYPLLLGDKESSYCIQEWERSLKSDYDALVRQVAIDLLAVGQKAFQKAARAGDLNKMKDLASLWEFIRFRRRRNRYMRGFGPPLVQEVCHTFARIGLAIPESALNLLKSSTDLHKHMVQRDISSAHKWYPVALLIACYGKPLRTGDEFSRPRLTGTPVEIAILSHHIFEEFRQAFLIGELHFLDQPRNGPPHYFQRSDFEEILDALTVELEEQAIPLSVKRKEAGIKGASARISARDKEKIVDALLEEYDRGEKCGGAKKMQVAAAVKEKITAKALGLERTEPVRQGDKEVYPEATLIKWLREALKDRHDPKP
ncbi:MAG: hypothetical protein WCN87_01735, partial [Chlamydiota bacterium]